MELSLWWRGALIGFAIAAPVGPIGLLCIQQTLRNGRKFGLFAGLGAASADAVYGAIAGFGLSVISDLLVEQRYWFGLVGGLFLCLLGIRTFLAPPASESVKSRGSGLVQVYLTTFGLTLTNPVTILSFIAIFAGLGLAERSGNYLGALTLVLGVFTGSASWWLLLSGSVSMLRSKFNEEAMLWTNRLAGFIIFGFGLYSLGNVWR